MAGSRRATSATLSPRRSPHAASETGFTAKRAPGSALAARGRLDRADEPLGRPDPAQEPCLVRVARPLAPVRAERRLESALDLSHPGRVSRPFALPGLVAANRPLHGLT